MLYADVLPVNVPILREGFLVGWGMIFDVLDKFLPSRKAALVDRMRELEADLAEALKSGQDTKAAELRVKLKDLRTKAKITEGDV